MKRATLETKPTEKKVLMLMRVCQATFYFVTKTRKNNSAGDSTLALVSHYKNVLAKLQRPEKSGNTLTQIIS